MLKFLFVGVGQCGNKLADTFASFKNSAVALNTTDMDMACLENIGKHALLNISAAGTTGGAGKTPVLGQKAMNEHLDEVLEKISAVGYGSDYIVLCGGLGGGTGSGGIPVLLYKLLSMKKKVMLLLTLPDDSEGAEVQINAYNAFIAILQVIENRNVPYILLDNNKIKARMASDTTFDWRSVNVYLGKIFSQFNRSANKNSPYATFDETDFKKVLYTSGMMTLVKCSMKPEEIATEASIADAVKAHWQENCYVDFEPTSATMVASIVEAPATYLDENYKLITAGLDKLQALCGSITPYNGIYPYDESVDQNKQGTVVVYCLLTGVKAPVEKLEALKKRATKEQEALKSKTEQNQIDLAGYSRLENSPAKKRPAEPEAKEPPKFTLSEDISDLDFL